MATRSAIGVMHGYKCKAVYCHWDGYLDHNGRIYWSIILTVQKQITWLH